MNRTSLVAAALAAAVVALSAGAQEPQAPAPSANPKVITVNGQPVYAAEISLMMQNVQGYLKSQGREAPEEEIAQVATQRVVEQKLLAQEATRFGVKPDEQRIAQMMQMTERQAGGRDKLEGILAKGGSNLAQLEQMFREMELGRAFIAQQVQPTIEVSDQEIATFYAEHPQDFMREEQVRARHILAKASPIEGDINSVRPLEVREPARMARSMTHLKLKHKDLYSPNLQQIIKRAFRRQAKQHHPDQGGNPALFRKLREAYEQLIRWSEKPTFTTRRGFPDKWFYEGGLDRWTQPAPLRRLRPID